MNEQPGQPKPSGFDALGQQARQDYRMGRDSQPFTDVQARALIDGLDDYSSAEGVREGRKPSQAAVAGRVGLSASQLSETRSWVLEGKATKTDVQKCLRLIDAFLANESARSDRIEVRDYVPLQLSERMIGVFRAAVRYSSMAVIVGPPGCGKTIFARAIAAEHSGALYARVNETCGSARGVSRMICEALRLPIEPRHPNRFASIMACLQKRRNVVFLIDEAQKLRADGLELLRDIFDGSDPEGRRNTPMLFLGDDSFLRLITRARNGETSAVKPQLTRRMYPFFSVSSDGAAGGSGAVFTEDDIRKLLRNERVKLISERGTGWLASLANTPGYGSLGFAVACLRMAADVATRRPLDTEDLQRALRMLLGPRSAEDVDQLAGGNLLRAVG